MDFRRPPADRARGPPLGTARGTGIIAVDDIGRRRRGVDLPHSSLYRFAIKHCGFRERGRFTVRMAECSPGELAEVDFGKLIGFILPAP